MEHYLKPEKDGPSSRIIHHDLHIAFDYHSMRHTHTTETMASRSVDIFETAASL
ncbi:MAG: hypothetical protein RSF83_09695 [Hungatella sp.]